LLYDSAYAAARSRFGPSSYFGYLRDLVRHHAGLPVVIAEFGVPSSRGLAHWQPQGLTHGGLDERAHAAATARLAAEIRDAGAAGAPGAGARSGRRRRPRPGWRPGSGTRGPRAPSSSPGSTSGSSTTG